MSFQYRESNKSYVCWNLQISVSAGVWTIFISIHVRYRWYNNPVTRCTKRNSRNFLHLWPSRQNQYCQSTARFLLAVVLVLWLRTRRSKSKNAKYLTAQLQYWYASLTKYICQEIVLVIIPPLTPPWPLDVLNKLIAIINWLIQLLRFHTHLPFIFKFYNTSI